MLTERPSAAVADPPPPLSSSSSNMADRQENNNTRQSPARSSSSTETAGAGGHLSTEQKRMFRFLHSALAIVSLLWITVCLLIYFHAPSYQSQQLFDCRWHLASLVVQACFGHFFVFCSRSALLFCAAFLASQYAIVYSLLTLIIYTLDTALLMLFPRSSGISMDFGPYLKLTAVFIVLSAFGLGLSLAHIRKLLQIGQLLGQGGGTGAITTTTAGATPTLDNTRTLRALTGCQAALALLSIYVAASLAPMKFWYVRTHLVQEFSCSLLAISLALLQFLIFRVPNGGGALLVKSIVLANACQIVQELNMALSAFYTFFYVGRIYDALEERAPLFTGPESAHIHLALNRVQHAQTVLLLNLIFHIGRMMLNAFMLWSLATKVFGAVLTYRVKFKLDNEMELAEVHWARVRDRERKWLFTMGAGVLAVAIGHVLLNVGYSWASMIFESLSVATGLSFVFSMCLLGAVGFYAYRMLRFCLVLSAYISLNLLITATLLLFAFIQDFFFLATTLDDDQDAIMSTLNSSSFINSTDNSTLVDSDTMDDSANSSSTLRILLYLADFALSVGTFLVAGLTLRYAVGTLVRTKVLQTQPTNVQRAIRLLRAFSLVGLVSAAVEFVLLAELRIEKTSSMSHLSVNSSFYDWLLTTAQFVFLFYTTRFERFQALLPVQILQLASVSITTLDLIGQQTETVQIYVNSVLQFYRLTEALFRRAPLLPDASRGGTSASAPSAIFVTHTTALAIPLHLFVDILALHFLQVVQWFLTVGSLGIALYCADKMVEDESEQSNDFHELRNGTNGTVTAAAQRAEVGGEESPPPPCPTNAAVSKPVVRNGGMAPAKHFNNAAFDNQMYNMEDIEAEWAGRGQEKKKTMEEEEKRKEEEDRKGKQYTSSNESSPYKDINLHS